MGFSSIENRKIFYLERMRPSFDFLKKSISLSRQELLRELQEQIGVFFSHIGILECSLVHPSCRGIDDLLPARCTNEMLEFLGDSVLSMVVTEFLFYEDPDFEEGLLSRIRAKVIAGGPLSDVALEIGLSKYLRVQSTALLTNRSILENAFESLVGGIYLDQGFESCKYFILRHLGAVISKSIFERDILDEKSLLQEIAQKKYFKHPEYFFENEHDHKDGEDFVMSVRINGKVISQASGKSKKEAMILCARQALKKHFGVNR